MFCHWECIDKTSKQVHISQCVRSSRSSLNKQFYGKFNKFKKLHTTWNSLQPHVRYSKLYPAKRRSPRHCDALGSNVTRPSAALNGVLAQLYGMQGCGCQRNVSVLVRCYALFALLRSGRKIILRICFVFQRCQNVIDKIFCLLNHVCVRH